MSGEAQTPLKQPKPRARSGRGLWGWKVWIRTVHLYTSLVGLMLALFFGSTGFMLNHGDWFGVGEKQTETLEGQVKADLGESMDRLALVEELRTQFGITSALVTLEPDEEEIFLRFARPGEDTDVVVQRTDGAAEVKREGGGAADILTDLHKGERSGAVGGLVVDAASILLVVIALTGFALWLALPKRRRMGLIAMGISAALLFAAIFVALGG